MHFSSKYRHLASYHDVFLGEKYPCEVHTSNDNKFEHPDKHPEYLLTNILNLLLGVFEDILDKGRAAEARQDPQRGEAARLLHLREGVHLVAGLEVLRGKVQREALQVRVLHVRQEVPG